MGQRPRSSSDSQLRAKMRLLMAAAALFVLLASLVWLICAVLLTELALIVTMSVFGGFFIVGLVFLAASAFINAEIVKAFLDATGPLRGVRP